MTHSKPRILLTFVLLTSVSACAKTPPPQPPSNEAAQETGETGGAIAASGLPRGVTDGALWTCVIDDYEPQPCKFHQDSGGWHLTKLMGSQRFSGAVTFTADGLHLVGEFFCPWGECTSPVDAAFAAGESDDEYTGTIDTSSVRLWWDETNAKDFGGAGYGGLTGREM